MFGVQGASLRQSRLPWSPWRRGMWPGTSARYSSERVTPVAAADDKSLHLLDCLALRLSGDAPSQSLRTDRAGHKATSCALLPVRCCQQHI